MRSGGHFPKQIQDLINAVGSNTSLPQDGVVFALELAIEEAVYEFFKIPECQVDIENKNITTFIRNLSAIEPGKTVSSNLKFPDIPFEMLSKNMIKLCSKLFARNLVLMESAHLYEKWKRNVHQVVEGVIHSVDDVKAEIHLGDNVQGLMLKPEWVPKESALYQKGALFWFYVSKIVQGKSAITVYLSRGSKNFPAMLLKEKLPWAHIRVVKRIRGEKTWLKSSALIDPEIIKALQRELKGEVIEIRKSDFAAV